MRTFETGATRDSNEDKLDYIGFLSPVALKAFAEYMHENRIQADGNMRSSDNWKNGMPIEEYLKSLCRHFMDVWFILETGYAPSEVHLVEALCAMQFNVQGILHEHLKDV